MRAAITAVHSYSGSRRLERAGVQQTRQTLSPKTAISTHKKLRNDSIVSRETIRWGNRLSRTAAPPRRIHVTTRPRGEQFPWLLQLRNAHLYAPPLLRRIQLKE